ncbi:MAG: bifunctional phosphoribosylaminoimidazolecarboxamide formyltransferase/IMP cyclohydrolase [Chitinophagales bacterium]
MKKIKSALISVFHKDGLEPVIEQLKNLNIRIYSTGGTQSFIEKQGAKVLPVEELTSYPSILGGRVKTLHPKVFGGILSRRDNQADVEVLEEYEIPEIDLVIVDLYPFEQTVAAGGTEQEIIEKIDIGGISLIRAAAKNFKDVLVVASRSEYANLLEVLDNNDGGSSIDERKSFAKAAFDISSHYDTAIFNYFSDNEQDNKLKLSMDNAKVLRYGENPHQQGLYFGELDALFEKLNGKELSYNNLVDIDAALALIQEFNDTTFVVIKHTNACGVATRGTLLEAWKDALAGDPVSAFGGILACNRKVDVATAEEISKLFFEVLIAPDYEPEALELLTAKKNRIVLKQKQKINYKRQVKSCLNGMLVQDYDVKRETEADLKTVTKLSPNQVQVDDLLFANILVKHLKSNTIVLAKGSQLLSMGCGQTSRVDALKQAIHKAEAFGFDLSGAVMASDAFFPFPDCVEIAAEAGIKSVIQPGGSVKDQLSIDACDEKGLSMVFTGTRHFKH